MLRGIKPDEFWEYEICSPSASTNICIWWPHLQDGKVALFARVRDVRLQERKGIANPFYDIGGQGMMGMSLPGRQLYKNYGIPPGNQTWQWTIPYKWRFLWEFSRKWSIFHCHVWLPEGTMAEDATSHATGDHWGNGTSDASDGRPFEKCGAVHAVDGWDGRSIFHAAWQGLAGLGCPQIYTYVYIYIYIGIYIYIHMYIYIYIYASSEWPAVSLWSLSVDALVTFRKLLFEK